MVERLRRPKVKPEDQDELYRAHTGEPDYPARYRACPVCRVKLGEPCVSLSGKIVNGRPDNVRTELPQPHTLRKRRTRR